MKHPRSEDVTKVVEAFDRAMLIEKLGAELDMNTETISHPYRSIRSESKETMLDWESHACGTVACHAGWFYAMSVTDRDKVHFEYDDDMDTYRLVDDQHIGDDRVIWYTDGAEMMAETLGFKRVDQLESWAARNPDIWGNKDGGGMFLSAKAFGFSTDRIVLDWAGDPAVHYRNPTLQEVRDHWAAVRDRLKKLEEGEKTDG